MICYLTLSIPPTTFRLYYACSKFSGSSGGSGSGSADNLGNHTATQDLNMAGHSILSAGGIGVGTNTPGQSLDVNGTIRSLRDDDFPSSPLEGGQLILNKASGYALSAYLDNYMNAFRVHNGTTELLKVDLTSGNVGVGVGSPAAKLDVAGTFKLADGTQGAGKVLTSDAAGNATWKDPGPGASMTYHEGLADFVAKTVDGAVPSAMTGTLHLGCSGGVGLKIADPGTYDVCSMDGYVTDPDTGVTQNMDWDERRVYKDQYGWWAWGNGHIKDCGAPSTYRLNFVCQKFNGGAGGSGSGSADNLGNHTATKNLDMAGNSIIGVNGMTANTIISQGDGGLELVSTNNDSSYVDFKSDPAHDYDGRIMYTSSTDLFDVTGKIVAQKGLFVWPGNKVGVGTASPQAELHVMGSIMADNIKDQAGNIIAGSPTVSLSESDIVAWNRSGNKDPIVVVNIDFTDWLTVGNKLCARLMGLNYGKVTATKPIASGYVHDCSQANCPTYSCQGSCITGASGKRYTAWDVATVGQGWNIPNGQNGTVNNPNVLYTNECGSYSAGGQGTQIINGECMAGTNVYPIAWGSYQITGLQCW